MKIKIFFLLFSSIASQALSIPSASAWKEILEAYDTVLEKVSQEESDCFPLKPKRIRVFFERVENFAARVKDHCSEFAGSGNENDFTRPSVDNPNRIEMMHNFYESIKSFQNAFVCMDGNTNKKWRPKNMVHYINRQIKWTEKCDMENKKPICLPPKMIEQFCNPEKIKKYPHYKKNCPNFSECREPVIIETIKNPHISFVPCGK